MLEQHDWTHSFSDDQSKWRKGAAQQKIIDRIAKTSPEHEKLCKEYRAYVWNEGAKPQPPQEKAFRTGESE